jgi:TPR repeat protein
MEEAPSSCANCGKEEEAEAKEKACIACKLVKYCGRDCQIAHRHQHKKACRKRAAELYDEELFKQPPKGEDCPICFLLLPDISSGKGHLLMPCCGKMICTGCCLAHHLQSRSNGSHTSCPFCRADTPSPNESIKMLEKRADANDAIAKLQLGAMYLDGDEDKNIKKDPDKAIKLLHRATELKCIPAYLILAIAYGEGNGVSKDETKARQYFVRRVLSQVVYFRDII